MHPVLFRIGGYEVASYAAALLVAFAAGIVVAERRTVARGRGHRKSSCVLA